jgi:phosphoenolpyruvate synthase/pyruvate phosphate dikinase
LAEDSFEGEESNPMLGFRGACTYIDKSFSPLLKWNVKQSREEKFLD